MQWRVLATPLFTHWRHRSVSGVGEGWTSSDTGPSSSSSAPHNPSAIFCTFDPAMEAHLQHLHAQLRVGQRKYQAEIDRYLVACRAPRFMHLVLPRGKAPHYDNLPDFSFYALSILDPAKDSLQDLQQVFLLLRQCTPLRRRTKRAQRELQWEPRSLQGMQHLVQSMQGTLLGLYPTCARPVAFVTRVHVYNFLRSLLVSGFGTLNTYLQRIRYILKICVMEHLCNTLLDYHPSICHMLNKSGQQLQHFCNAVTTMCDLFRGDLNLHFARIGCIVGTLLHLEKSAHSFFERCTRAYRGIITGQSSSFTSLDLFRRLSLVPSMRFMEQLASVYVTPNQYIFDLVHRTRLPPESFEAFWHLTQCISVHTLPPAIRDGQQLALARRYPQVCVLLLLLASITPTKPWGGAGHHLHRTLQAHARLRLLRHQAQSDGRSVRQNPNGLHPARCLHLRPLQHCLHTANRRAGACGAGGGPKAHPQPLLRVAHPLQGVWA